MSAAAAGEEGRGENRDSRFLLLMLLLLLLLPSAAAPASSSSVSSQLEVAPLQGLVAAQGQ
jgi:hypothetical protein